MHVEQLRHHLETLEAAGCLLAGWALRDPERGYRNLTSLHAALGVDGLRVLCHPLGRLLPRCPDPDMALNNLERLMATPAGAATLPVLLESRARTLETLLQLFSTSQFLSDFLAGNPDSLDMLRVPLRRSPSLAEMQTQLQAEVDGCRDDSAVLRAFRRFRQRQLVRIGTNDIIRARPLEEITRDISRVAEASVGVALAVALRSVTARFGRPVTTQGAPARCAVLAFGKLGGEELNYSSDIDLMFVYDREGASQGRRGEGLGHQEFFGRVVGEVVRLLSSITDRGQAYRVDLRLRPEGHRGPLAMSLASTLSYYDSMGRTWERQALIKVRPVAGDLSLGDEFLHAIEPFIYRKYFSFSEINEIKALKHKIEQKASQAGASRSDVKTGHGGIRDIEFTIQFLQLLNGGDLHAIRQRNTLNALSALEQVGCLTNQEYHLLEDAYRFLRKTEHRLQLMFDLQTHRLPDNPDELRRLARRMGYDPPEDPPEEPSADGEPEPRADEPVAADEPGREPRPAAATAPSKDPLDAFLADYSGKSDLNRKILDHLLHQTFQQEGGEGRGEPETDLILDPDPDPEVMRAVLDRYRFRDVQVAYQNLTLLATETVRFLSTRRCRHFLASIAPRLLRALAQTPDPDMTLMNLEKVTASLGAKAVLWELFSLNPPSLKLYVELCAGSQFLSEILINNPGMLDELLDSLLLNQRRTAAELRSELADLCRGATDPAPILHSFRDKELLRIGVRDILGRDSIQATTASLSDVAEVILEQIARGQEPGIVRRFGTPVLAAGPRAGQPSRYALLALGKLGGRELSYHSDLDLILIYEGDGRTEAPAEASRFDRFELTDNFHYFTELAQRIIRAMSYLGPMGRLYHIDMRLRPTGKSGSLVIPLAEFRRYYDRGGAQLWERQALTRARLVQGDPEFGQEVMAAVAGGACLCPWRPEDAEEIRAMRERVEAARSPTNSGKTRDLKRGVGGLIDIEFLVQLFQLKYAADRPGLRKTNTWDALDALAADGLVSQADHATLRKSYSFLRQVESRLRMVYNRSEDDLPEAPEELNKLARRLGSTGPGDASAGERFLAEMDRSMGETREVFVRLLEQERLTGAAPRAGVSESAAVGAAG